jgi:nicotinate-nucleotide adenylyltransferase
MKRIGIYGGSFNPIHHGHLSIAEIFIRNTGIEICYFVPSNISPFKIDDKANSIESIHRLSMLKLALEDYSKLEIDDFEIANQGISFTYLTITHFRRKFPNDKLFLLIGSDQAEKFHLWKNWEYILEQCTLVIAKRGSEKTSSFIFQDKKPDCEVIILNNQLIEISSTDIRNRIMKGIDCSGLLPQKVNNYIFQNQLYQE